MIYSMTGFGASKSKSPKGTVITDIKTVNHRFLEISLKLPPNLWLLEDKIKKAVQKHIKRGKVYVTVTCEEYLHSKGAVYIDMGLAEQYYKKLNLVKKTFNLNEIKVSDIASFPGIVNYRVLPDEAAALWPLVLRSLSAAIKLLKKDRKREGGHLANDLGKRVRAIEKEVSKVEKRAEINIKKYKKNISKKVREIMGGQGPNKERLENEAVLYAKNADITEEITRLRGHLGNFGKLLQKGGESGKKMDFAAQEMHRETNTIGAKSSDYMIAASVIEMKSDIEKIREQVKNIE